jgi:hypothetical protein
MMRLLPVLVVAALSCAACKPAVRSYPHPERLEWEVVDGEPTFIQVFDSTGTWSLGCSSGAFLLLAGPLHVFPYGRAVAFTVGSASVSLSPRRAEGPTFYAYGSPTAEDYERMRRGGPVRLISGRRTITLRPMAPGFARTFADACLDAQGGDSPPDAPKR